ncbi:MAG: nickel pincer cofactor biosynthesis protein LarC [Spirochaetes bacterium]|nr:nickel pincer cofactor biosynthesis protein LarC [Spirochaetota bacterium]
MKKSVFFDIQLGASGDMLIGSLLDIGSDSNELKNMLFKLKLPNWTISPKKIIRHNIAGTLADISCKDDSHHRNLNDMRTIVTKSGLPENITNNIIKIFENLANAEAKVHGKKPDEIHFHEIGAIDSIIDISAFCILMDIIPIDKIYYNTFNLGSGTIKCSHGEIPLPAPATAELIKNHRSTLTDKKGELVTPTAAAILTTLGIQTMPADFIILESGIGFGTRDYPFASFTRAFIIENLNKYENVQQIECNIDDMNPQLYPVIIEMLFDAGALDAYTSAISMKKGRPAILLTVIANIEKIPHLSEIIYSQTTTLGIRLFNITRDKLHREYETVSAFGEKIKVKIGYLNNNAVNIQPEFEDCRAAANKAKIPLKEVIAEAIHQYKIKEK